MSLLNTECEVGNNFQLFYFDTPLQFTDARATGADLGVGADLVVSTDQATFDEIIALRDLSGSTAQVFVGIFDPDGEEGAARGDTGRFQSVVDGSIPEFTSGPAGVNPWRNNGEPFNVAHCTKTK